MTIDVYSMTGQKGKSMELPASLFGADVNWGLMHQAVLTQQGNRRSSGAHVKTRGEVQASTKKLFSQKHTGQARRGAVSSPLLRGGGKTFGPRNVANYARSMPKKMRHAALRSCLSLQAQKGNVLVLEGYPDEVKTKTFAALLKKLPIEAGRSVLVVSPGKMKSLQLSARNVPSVTTVYASYLNPEGILNARYVLFLADAVKEAEQLFGKKDMAAQKLKLRTKKEASETPAAPKKAAAKAKKTAAKKSSK